MRKHPKIVTTTVTLVLGGLIGFGAFAGVLKKTNSELKLAKNRAEEARYVAEQVKGHSWSRPSAAQTQNATERTITVYEVLTRFPPRISRQVNDPRIEADLNQAIGQTLVRVRALCRCRAVS